tara:strand:- start:163 stop:468 length:306 start_codon:yes stop_codon:yes gene_type:complete
MREYYEFYLTLHKNKWNRRLHFVGQLFTILYVFLCVYYNRYWFLLLSPFVVYPFAWLGHSVFEKNKPLAWGGIKDRGLTTLKAKACDAIMFWNILTGKIGW